MTMETQIKTSGNVVRLKKRELGKYKMRISMSIDQNVFLKLERARGKILRSTFIEDLIKDHVK